MLPRKNRLPKFFKGGRSFTGESARIFFMPNGLPDSRFGLSIKSGLFKKAVERNRIKRLIRECLRSNLPRIKSGFDVFLVVQKKNDGILQTDFWLRELSFLLKAARIYV